MASKQSIAHMESFKPRPSDVFVVTYPKCGTTWVTQICHGLRSRGSMDFGEITEVCPWDAIAYDCGQNLNDEQVANPRVFKSHEAWKDVPKGAKYVYVCRDPFDAFWSFYKFLPRYAGIPDGAISISDFADSLFSGASNSGQICNHFLSFWDKRKQKNVLWVTFEDLKSDLPREIRRIAKFMEIDVENDPELFDIVLRQSKFDFMASHQSQFNDAFVFSKVKEQMGMGHLEWTGEAKVRKGGGQKGTGKKEVPKDILDRLDAAWAAVMKGTGLKNYADMQRTLHEERGLE